MAGVGGGAGSRGMNGKYRHFYPTISSRTFPPLFPYYISVMLSNVCERSHTRYNVILTVTLQVGENDIYTHLQIGNQGSK